MADQTARRPMSDDERIQAFLDAFREDDDFELVDQVRAYVYLTIGDLRGMRAERDRLAARLAELEAHPWIEVVWLTTDDEGNFGVWNNPDRARQRLAHDRAAETPGAYEWVNGADRTCELLLRDGEPTGLTLRMALVADANEGA